MIALPAHVVNVRVILIPQGEVVDEGVVRAGLTKDVDACGGVSKEIVGDDGAVAGDQATSTPASEHDVACDQTFVGSVTSTIQVNSPGSNTPPNISIDHDSIVRMHVEPMVQAGVDNVLPKELSAARRKHNITLEQPLTSCSWSLCVQQQAERIRQVPPPAAHAKGLEGSRLAEQF